MDRLFSRGKRQAEQAESKQPKRAAAPKPKDLIPPAPVALRGLLKDNERPKLRNVARNPLISPQSSNPTTSRPRRPSQPQPQPTVSLPQTSPPSLQPSTLTKLSQIDYLSSNPQKTEQQFINIVSPDLKVSNLKLTPLNENGAQLMADGQFMVLWCRMLERNPYVNCGLLFRRIYEDYQGRLVRGREEFVGYLRQKGVLPKQTQRQEVADGNNGNSGQKEGKKAGKSSGKKNNQEVVAEKEKVQVSPRRRSAQKKESISNKKPIEENKPIQQDPSFSFPTQKDALYMSFAPTLNIPQPTAPPVLASPYTSAEIQVVTKPLIIPPTLIPSPTKTPIIHQPITKQQPPSPPKSAAASTRPKTFAERMQQAKASSKPDIIAYPDLSDIKDIVTPKDKLKDQLVTQNDRYVIDYFQLNDIYLLRQLKIVAILENDYKDLGLYCVVLVTLLADKEKEKPREFTAISALRDTSEQKVLALKEIAQKYEIQAFIVREPGQEIGKHWMSGIEV